mmetsp:Transcript_20801/g.38702  ORF Transcript_20801/g.38702 Transcript_20801/m.38702 type:complete len:80 (+) Transcript_20801:124-363(+)
MRTGNGHGRNAQANLRTHGRTLAAGRPASSPASARGTPGGHCCQDTKSAFDPVPLAGGERGKWSLWVSGNMPENSGLEG